MEKFKAVLDLQSKHRSALGYGLVTLLTAGGEKIFSVVVFQCPCSATWNLPYGLVFLLVPALALFVLGYALSARTWRLLTGCCSGSRSSSSGSHSAFVCAQITAAAAVPAVTWVAVALLGGSFYQCAVSGSTYMAKRLCGGGNDSCVDKLPQVPCNKQEAKMQDILSQLKAQSQVLGWVLIAVVIVLLLAVKSVIRCLSPVSYLQLQFWEIYTEKEGQILQKEASENATQLAQENVRCFFECSDPRECKTPSSKAWQHISALYTYNSKNQFYSMLHKYVNRKGAAGGLSSTKEDASKEGASKEGASKEGASKEGAPFPALSFVDESTLVNTHRV